MSEIKLAAWNAQNAFGDQRQSAAYEMVKRLDADVLYLGEFGPDSYQFANARQDQIDQFAQMGYSLRSNHYYHRGRPYGHREHYMAIADRTGGDSDTFLAGNRWAFHLATDGLDIAAVHHEDYRESDRLQAAKQTTRYLDGLDTNGDKPQVIIGDFNAIDPVDKSAALTALRLAHPSTESLRRYLSDSMEYYRSPRNPQDQLNRLGSLAIRLADMSAGTTVDWYRQQNFVQADEQLHPTIGLGRGRRPLFKLDHILGRNVAVSHHQTHRTDLSDHAAISATISY